MDSISSANNGSTITIIKPMNKAGKNEKYSLLIIFIITNNTIYNPTIHQSIAFNVILTSSFPSIWRSPTKFFA